MFGTLDNTEIEELFNNQAFGRIGCHRDGRTYIIPINYIYHENAIYCHSHAGMKIDIMRQNPKVCFEIESINENGKWRTAIAFGTYSEISNESQRKEILQLILEHPAHFKNSKTIKAELGKSFPFAPADLNEIGGIVFAIYLEEKTGRFEKIDWWMYENIDQ